MNHNRGLIEDDKNLDKEVVNVIDIQKDFIFSLESMRVFLKVFIDLSVVVSIYLKEENSIQVQD